MSRLVTTHRELVVWQRGMQLLMQVYRVARLLPSDERFALGSQLRRAAVSIPANIAEGHARVHRREFINHLSIARGSLAEVETLLEAAVQLEFVAPEQAAGALTLADEVRRMLSAFLRRLRQRD